jgi:hypothetical protein
LHSLYADINVSTDGGIGQAVHVRDLLFRHRSADFVAH